MTSRWLISRYHSGTDRNCPTVAGSASAIEARAGRFGDVLPSFKDTLEAPCLTLCTYVNSPEIHTDLSSPQSGRCVVVDDASGDMSSSRSIRVWIGLLVAAATSERASLASLIVSVRMA